MANTKTSKETTKPNNDAKKVEKLEAQLKEQKEQAAQMVSYGNQPRSCKTKETMSILGWWWHEETLVLDLICSWLSVYWIESSLK